MQKAPNLLEMHLQFGKWADEARIGTHPISQLWDEESSVMVKLASGRLLYGDVKIQLTHEISKGGLIQYMISKNLLWNEKIFQMVDWKGMESTLKKMNDTEVTNVLKMAHGWQHDGYQKYLFAEDGETYECPAGCGEMECRLHFVICKAVAVKLGHKQKLEKFKEVHKRLKTAGVIYQAFLGILQHLREGGDPPSSPPHF